MFKLLTSKKKLYFENTNLQLVLYNINIYKMDDVKHMDYNSILGLPNYVYF